MAKKSWHHPYVEIRAASPDTGQGIFAKGLIRWGDIICVTQGIVLTNEEVAAFSHPLHAFQIEVGLQLAPEDPNDLHGIFSCNHSCSPNAGIRNASSLVALRDIQANEQICYDYVMTDFTLEKYATVKMDCKCRAATCRHIITDLDWRSPALRKRYAGYFSAYMEDEIERHTTQVISAI